MPLAGQGGLFFLPFHVEMFKPMKQKPELWSRSTDALSVKQSLNRWCDSNTTSKRPRFEKIETVASGWASQVAQW